MRRRTRPDDATFEHWVREHHAAVYGSALRVLGREADAQDVAQGVFLALLEGRVVLEPDSARPLLRWHAVRAALTHRRAAQRRTAREEATVLREVQRPDEVVQAEDERAGLWRELLALPDDQRVPLVLRFAESMTFKEIGAALGIAQPTAHERVAKGLERLRARLSGLGYVALASGLEEQLATCPAPVVPAGLERRLLELQGAHVAVGGAVGLGAWMLAGVLVAAGTWGAVRGIGAGETGDPPALVAANGGAPAEGASVPVDTPAPPAPRQPLAEPDSNASEADTLAIATEARELHGWLTGHVLGSDGAPLAGLALRATSLEREGKFPAWSAPGRTDANGAFRIRVELPTETGRNVRLAWTEPPQVTELVPSVRVLPDRTSELGRLELAAPGVRGSLEPVPVALLPTGVVSGSIVSTEGPPPRWIQVFMPAGSRWNNADYAPDTGRFTLTDVAAGTHVLRVQPQGWMDWSPVELSVSSGSSDLLVTLKRASDPRDVGDHDAELHGRLLDAATRAPVECAPGSGVEIIWSPRPFTGDAERDFLPNHIWPSPRQVSEPPDTGEDPYRVPEPSSAFHLVGLRPGTYLVHHHVPGRARGVLGPFELAEREVRAGLEARLQLPATARIRVVDPTGEPVESAWVFFTGSGPYSDAQVARLDAAYRDRDGRGSFWGGGGRRTDTAGASTHKHLPAGAHLRVAVIHPGFDPFVGSVLELEPGAQTEVISLRFARAR